MGNIVLKGWSFDGRLYSSLSNIPEKDRSQAKKVRIILPEEQVQPAVDCLKRLTGRTVTKSEPLSFTMKLYNGGTSAVRSMAGCVSSYWKQSSELREQENNELREQENNPSSFEMLSIVCQNRVNQNTNMISPHPTWDHLRVSKPGYLCGKGGDLYVYKKYPISKSAICGATLISGLLSYTFAMPLKYTLGISAAVAFGVKTCSFIQKLWKEGAVLTGDDGFADTVSRDDHWSMNNQRGAIANVSKQLPSLIKEEREQIFDRFHTKLQDLESRLLSNLIKKDLNIDGQTTLAENRASQVNKCFTSLETPLYTKINDVKKSVSLADLEKQFIILKELLKPSVQDKKI